MSLSRETRDNTTKTIHLISYIPSHNLKVCLLSFSMPKRLSLEQIGLGAPFISKVMSLYSQLSASVLVNGTSSEPFGISNSIRQKSPLSPLLFVLVVDYLANAICQNSSIQGIQTPPSHHKISLFADDLMVYVQQPYTSLPSLFYEFRRFGSFSNFKINTSQTEALNVSLPVFTMSSLLSNYSFQWQTKGISCLGVAIPANLSNLFSLNPYPNCCTYFKPYPS